MSKVGISFLPSTYSIAINAFTVTSDLLNKHFNSTDEVVICKTTLTGIDNDFCFYTFFTALNSTSYIFT